MNLSTGGAQHPPFPAYFGRPPQYPQNRGSPPIKKSKGNPIITRYPPPPGYPPCTPQPNHFQPVQWQHQTQAPGYGYSPYSGHQPPPLAQTQLHHVPPTQFTGYPPQQAHVNAFPLCQPAYTPGAQAGWQASISPSQNILPSMHHQQLNPYDRDHDPRRRHGSSASIPLNHLQAAHFDDNIDPYPPQFSPGPPDDDDNEGDFEQACYFAQHPEDINPDLSLGLIEWKAPLPTRRPLPSTFADAELEALAPRVPKASDDESISDYFIKSQRDESLNSVRLSETWHEIKDDLIFKEFPAVCCQLLSMYELLSQYKDRVDPEWAVVERVSPTPELSREPTPAPEKVRNDSMDVKNVHDLPDDKVSISNSSHRILDDLEQALGSQIESSTPADQRLVPSRSTSATSQSLPRSKRPKPLPPLRNQAQENVLAALGVTGSPKMVYETPGPAFGPRPELRPEQPSRSNSSDRKRTESQRLIHPLPALPLPKRGLSPSSDQWKNGQPGNFYSYERTSSVASQRTPSGVDHRVANDNNANPRPRIGRQDSRKRGYADSEIDIAEDREPFGDEATLRQRRKQARVGRAY